MTRKVLRPVSRATVWLFGCLSVLAGSPTLAAPPHTNETPAWLEPYNIVWTAPATKALHSMPCGGGNIALNVWATRNELLFYIASPDSWDGRTQVKMGRVRVTFAPNPLEGDFRQELNLADNSIRVSGRAGDGTELKLRVWVDAFHPVVHVEGESSRPVQATASIELIGSARARFDGDSAVWHVRIDGSSPQRTQGIAQNKIEAIAAAVPDPMENHTWGGRLAGTEFSPTAAVKSCTRDARAPSIASGPTGR